LKGHLATGRVNQTNLDGVDIVSAMLKVYVTADYYIMGVNAII
jgi:hypothetical protein